MNMPAAQNTLQQCRAVQLLAALEGFVPAGGCDSGGAVFVGQNVVGGWLHCVGVDVYRYRRAKRCFTAPRQVGFSGL